MASVRSVLVGVCVTVAAGAAAYAMLHDDGPPPHITAPTAPYKRLVTDAQQPADVATDSTVHAVMGGSAAHDPSMEGVVQPPKNAPVAVPADVPTGFSVPQGDAK